MELRRNIFIAYLTTLILGIAIGVAFASSVFHKIADEHNAAMHGAVMVKEEMK